MADRKQQFIQALLPYAQAFERKTGIPAAYALAMAANETGWNAANPVLFGIKGPSPSGKSGTFQTWESEGGRRVDQPAQFATYADPGEAFDHLAQNMASARYKDAPKGSPQAFAGYLQKQGWATDPDYASKIARLAAEIGDQTGGTPMPDDTTPSNGQAAGPQSNKNTSLDFYDKAIAKSIKDEQDAEQELRDIAAQIANLPNRPENQLRNQDGTTDVNQQKVDAARRPLELQAAAASKKMDRARQDQQRNLQERERIRNQRNVEADTVSKLIDNQIKAISQEIAAGKLSYDSGMAQVNAIQDEAAKGATSVLSAQTQLREGASKMASPATRDAIEASIRGYSAFGAPALPGGHFLTLTPFDPMAAIKDYLPRKPDWEAWKQGLTGAKSGLDQYLSQHVEPGMEAIRGLVAQRQGQNQPTNTPTPPPQRPYVMMPSDAPDVPVYGGQVEPSAPPPPSAVPSRGGQFPEGGDLWKQAVLGRTPGEDAAARVQTGGLSFGLGSMGNASAPASATPVPSTPVPTATPTSQEYNSPEEMLDDPSLTPEQKLQLLEQMRYGQQ